MAGALLAERSAYLLADVADMAQVQVAVELAWRSDANKGKVCIMHGACGIGGSGESAFRFVRGDHFADLGLDHRRLPAINEIYFVLGQVNSRDLMPFRRKARR